MDNPKPLTLDELRERADKWYWHVSLQGNESKWVYLVKSVALYAKDYHYGETWLAYDHELKEDTHK